MIIGLDAPELVDVDLVCDIEPVLGQAAPAEDREGGRLRAGRMLTRRLTPATVSDDRELKHFLDAEAGSFDYHLIRLVCTFIDKTEERFESAWIKVDLSRVDDREDPDSQPVAWSVEPERLSRPSGIVHGVEVTVPAKLVTAAYRRQATAGEQTYLQAKFVASSRPTWYLTRTREYAIDGDVDLRVVARIPSGIQACADFSAGAAIRRRIGKIIPHVADLQDPPPTGRLIFGA